MEGEDRPLVDRQAGEGGSQVGGALGPWPLVGLWLPCLDFGLNMDLRDPPSASSPDIATAVDEDSA